MSRFNRGRKSPADKKRAINAHLRFLAQGSDNPRAKDLLTMQTPVREYKPRKPSGHPLERNIVADIIKALRSHPRVATVQRRTSGVFRDGNRWIKAGQKGEPDITGILKGGRAYGIEVKRPGKYPEEHQWRRIYEIRNAGGLAGCAHSIEEAIAIING